MEDNSIMKSDQYLTFKLKEETYGVNIVQILEILEYKIFTKIPQTPEYLGGVTNLRGKAIPVIDMRIKLGMEKGEISVNSSIIVMDIKINEENITLGILADSVCEVIEIAGENIESVPKIGKKLNTDFIRGIGKKDNKFIIILNIERIFSYDELTQIQQFDDNKSLQ